MRRTSFFGALTVIAVGGVLAFALRSSPRDLDLRATGLIIMIAGVADLVIRFLLADSPLLGQRAADVAAVMEPIGEPVLDVFGNPIATEPARVLQPPPLEVPGVYAAPAAVVPASAATGLVPGVPVVPSTSNDDGTGNPPVEAEETRVMAPMTAADREALRAEESVRHTVARDDAAYDQVVRQVGDYEPPASLAPVSALTGRPMRVGRRNRRRERRG